jgi:hypothetical protein
MTAGALMQAVGLAAVAATFAVSWPGLDLALLVPALIVTGAGQGLVMSPLFRVVLSEVPPDKAGAASGVLTTTPQTSLALGVGTLGSLYLTVSPAAHLGVLDATVMMLIVLVAIAGLVSLLSRRLPD